MYIVQSVQKWPKNGGIFVAVSIMPARLFYTISARVVRLSDIR